MKFYTKMEIDIMVKDGKKIIFVKNNIYDVTNFIHLFGILPFNDNNRIKTDVSIDYNFHGKNSKNTWEKYKIGQLYNKCDCSIS